MSNHKARLGRLELRATIVYPPAPVLDLDRLGDEDGEILEQAGLILARAEQELLADGGTVPDPLTRAYFRAVGPYVSDEDLELLEQAATIQERIRVDSAA
jgi:hypothetical protein